MIRKATLEDEIEILFDETKANFKKQGIDQWQNPNGYPNKTDIISDINEGKGYVYEQNNIVKAYFYLQFEFDETYQNIYNGKWLTNKPYAVIHRIVVADKFKRCGIADEIFQFVKQLAQKNDYNIRIDTHKDNIPMKRLIEKNNYQYCGIILTHDNSERLAYELNIT
ncbi:MAG: hypothetical protein BEN19_01340 [Epulopiscium sp. Nuni2H_MBin003]|nr:MAG: hypothetical protein BEN19_01340 [Epulopiscium sp. Nuni2H_MBin003]